MNEEELKNRIVYMLETGEIEKNRATNYRLQYEQILAIKNEVKRIDALKGLRSMLLTEATIY